MHHKALSEKALHHKALHHKALHHKALQPFVLYGLNSIENVCQHAS